MRKLIGLAALTLTAAFSTLSMASPASATTLTEKQDCTNSVNKIQICHTQSAGQIYFNISHDEAFGDTLKVDVWSNLQGDFDSREVTIEPPSVGLFLNYTCNTNGEYFTVKTSRNGASAAEVAVNCSPSN